MGETSTIPSQLADFRDEACDLPLYFPIQRDRKINAGRFLAVLSWLHKKDAAAFSVVEEIRGRGRIYFSKSVQELEQSGRSVNPKKIPDSPFWVITTTPTDLKQQILGEVMKALGCDLASIQLAKRAIAR